MSTTKTALITGASAGLGRALATELASDGWEIIITARGGARLADVAAILGDAVLAVPGDVSDPAHRSELAEILRSRGTLDLLVNNASRLGPSPMPAVRDYPLDELRRVFDTNVVAPVALLQIALPYLRASSGITVQISSDAALGAYSGWGGYGSSKAALDQLSAIAAVENPAILVYSVDPGDMRTEMHQAAFPGEDISDRPEPGVAAAALMQIIRSRPPSGRYLACEVGSEVLA